ncbi:MAG: winged helix-turn-helix domain-containing protein [Cyanobacteria bacterium P01_A01_bin.135]
MKIPQKPPTSPVQAAILAYLQPQPRTKAEITAALDSPASSVRRAIKALVALGQIKSKQVGDDVYYRVPVDHRARGKRGEL